MTRWRWSVAVVLLALVGVPCLLPLVALAFQIQGRDVWREGPRLAELAGNTLRLVGGTLALAVPAGVVGAVLLERTDLPLRGFLRRLTLLTLFVPLPLLTSAWQATLGTSGLLPVLAWSTPPEGDPDISASGIPWKPWAQGLGAAIWVSALAGLPWVIWLVGQGLRGVERGLEEDALLGAGPWRVLLTVTLPRCGASLFAASAWVAVQTATEITVTDMMQVRTFAEEVYIQFVRPTVEVEVSIAALVARAVAISVPALVLMVVLILAAAQTWERRLPATDAALAPPIRFPLGRARWLILVALLAGVGVLVGVPLAGLVWKAGLGGNPEAWTLERVGTQLAVAVRVRGGMLAESVAIAGLAGGITAGLALLACWLALESRALRTLTLVLMALLWALPAPVLGLGLKDAIEGLLDQTHSAVLAAILYYGPSPLPVMWADLLRFFPFAVALLWPTVRLLPRELREAARLDGARPVQELLILVVPLTSVITVRTALAVMVLSLGELTAGKLVETPGAQTLAHFLFERMHYGVTNEVAALCLLLLLLVAFGGGSVAWLGALPRRQE